MESPLLRGAAVEFGNNSVYAGITYYGRVRHFNAQRGYGTIYTRGFPNPAPGPPSSTMFFHVSSLIPRISNAAVAATHLRRTVQFQIVDNPRKPNTFMATNIQLSGVQVDSPADDWESTGRASSLNDFLREEPSSAERTPPNSDPIQRNNLPFRLTDYQMQHQQAALDMGFSRQSVNAAFRAVDTHGRRKMFEDIVDFLDEVVSQETYADLVKREFGEFPFALNSDDHKFDTWALDAEQMGFEFPFIAQCLEQVQPDSTFQELIEVLVSKKPGGTPPGGPGLLSSATLASLPEAERFRLIRKHNQTLRDFFSCKICMSADAVVIFFPCGHISCCEECSKKSPSTCPCCRQATNEKKTATISGPPTPPQRAITYGNTAGEIAHLEQENIHLHASQKCKICKVRDRAVYYQPCGHIISCQGCSRSVLFCPTCRAFVKEKRNVYFA